MVMNLLRVNKAELDGFLDDSGLLEEKFYDDGNYDADWYIDIDKAWDGVQFLLSGKSGMQLELPLNPIDRVMFTFQLIDEEQDLGYGPAQYLTPEQVKETSAALSSITFEEFVNRYNGEEMERIGVYPSGWSDPESKEYVTDALKVLIEFYKIAANNNEAVITVLN